MAGPYRAAAEVNGVLRAADVRPSLRRALGRYEAGRIAIAPRGALGLAPDGAVTHAMTARDLDEQLVLTKVVDYDPGRPRRDGRATAAGLVLLLRDGWPVLVTSADEFTGIRTGQTTAFAIDGLLPAGALEVALLGPGLVGRETLRALERFRTLTGVRILGSSQARSREAAEALGAGLSAPVHAVTSLGEATAGADVLVTATSVVEPLVDATDIADSVRLIAAIGAGIAERRELTAAAVAACDTVVVDTVEGALSEAGDLVQAAFEGIEPQLVPLGAALDAPPVSGRTLYKSVGSPWQDLGCLLSVLEHLSPDPASEGPTVAGTA